MEESPEMIRQQLDETKSQLTEKLESLEHQVSETVQSTGETVEAIHETVETVTGVVHDAVECVNYAFDIRGQMSRHPLMVIGGAALVGFVLAKTFAGRQTASASVSSLPVEPGHASNHSTHHDPRSTPAVDAIAAAYESGARDSSWRQLQVATFTALLGIAQDVAVRAIPIAISQLLGKPRTQPDASHDPAQTSEHPSHSNMNHDDKW